MLELQPISFADAAAFVKRLHRHHLPPVGHKLSIGLNDGDKLVGVLMAGRPVARHFDDGWTLEVTRCCTDGTKNACSKLYSAAMRAARALGYRRIVTYTLPSESGASLRAAGYRTVWQTSGGSWNCPSRPRTDKGPTGPKLLWERPLEQAAKEQTTLPGMEDT